MRCFLACLAALASACASPSPSPQIQERVPANAVSPPAPPPAPGVLAIALPGEEARRSEPVAAPGRASALELPVEQAFVTALLPAPRPERYRSFAQASRIVVGKGYLHEVDLFPGEEWLLAMSDDEASVRVYERKSARLVGNHVVPGFRQFETGGVRAWPEGDPRFVVASADGLFLYDARAGGLVETLAHEKLNGVRWSPDRRILVARDAGPLKGPGRLHFYARVPADEKVPGRSSLRPLGAVDFPERIDAFDLSADNRLIATAGYPSGDLVVTDLRSGAPILSTPGPDFGGAVAFSPDGRFVAMGGQGLLLVDLLNPARRAFYSHVDNNIGHVRFSPSGDAVVASSYDGRLRIFLWNTEPRDGRIALKLSLAQTLRHEGQANVYAFVFEGGGDGIVSVSGDRTIRTFRAPRSVEIAAREQPPSRTFHSLSDWARLDPDGARPFPPAPEPSVRDGHYHPPILDGAPRPSRILPGNYACKITLIYKLRDCRVSKDERGHTLLRFGPDNLLELEGVLYDEGPVVRFEAWQRQKSTVGATCRGCEKQPLHAVFRGAGRRYDGLLTFRNYYDPFTPPEPPPGDVKIEESTDRYPMVLEYRGPLN